MDQDPYSPDDIGPDAESPPAPTARFCPHCGEVLDPVTLTCTHCRAAEPAEAQRFAGGVFGVITLYFAILSTAVIGFFGEGTVYLIAISVVDAALVLVWSLCCSGRIDLGVRPATGRALGLAAALSIPLFGISWLTVWLVRDFAEWEIRLVEMFMDDGYGWIAIIMVVCVQPAIIEELAFRGVILGALRDALTDREAVWVSAVMFAIIHLAFLSLPHLIIVGVVLGWMRIRSRSILPCMVLHFAHNLWCVILEAVEMQHAY